MATSVSALEGTPYLIPEDEASVKSFMRVAGRNGHLADQSRRIQAQISQEATELLEPFLRARRSDLVAESNQIEGYDVSREQVLEAVTVHRELLRGDVHGLMQAMRADPKIVNALGLYKAQEIADEWGESGQRPRAFEMRQLHALLAADDRIGGQFRTRDVGIGGTSFRPPAHFDVPQAMDQFAEWWLRGTGDPALDATIAHAWLTHIHPYEDGNGRLARVLANLALGQAKYPPLVVRSGVDRGEYYAALAASDEGNILPLYKLFAQIIRRTVRAMSAPGYTHDFLEDRLLSSLDDQRTAWCALVIQFAQALERCLSPHGWSLDFAGIPDRVSFQLLIDRNADGNGWFQVVRDNRGSRRWLLWFGFTTHELLDLFDRTSSGYPSIFISRRDPKPGAPHPFIQETMEALPDELFLRPLEANPLSWREGYDHDVFAVAEGAERVAKCLMRDR